MRSRSIGFLFSALLLTQSVIADQSSLVPRTDFDGPVLEFEFPGMQIGIAEYDEGPTGATVFYFPMPSLTAVDIIGGAPGTMNTDSVRKGSGESFMKAVTLAGGSWYGLAAGTGVADAIKDATGSSNEWYDTAGVVSAIIWDLGGRRFNAITPDYELGRAALNAAVPGRFPLGARGAGRLAMQGAYVGSLPDRDTRMHSGQGGAFRQVGETKIAVFTVVNAYGSIVDRDGRIVRCSDRPDVNDCGYIADLLKRKYEAIESSSAVVEERRPGPTQATTVTLVVTNQKLEHWALQRLATHVHTSMARAIQPFGTEGDGDTLYAVTTGAVENPNLSTVDLAAIAADVAWDAVLASVPEREALPELSEELPAADLARFEGTYEFAPGDQLVITAGMRGLVASYNGQSNHYFAPDRPITLQPAGPNTFLIDEPASDYLRFAWDGNEVESVILNPGNWQMTARRID